MVVESLSSFGIEKCLFNRNSMRILGCCCIF